MRDHPTGRGAAGTPAVPADRERICSRRTMRGMRLSSPGDRKVVVITGATSGLGHSCALQLAGRGLKVVIVGRDPAKAAATLRELDEAAPGADHAAHIADLTLMDATARVAREILE